jgi:hypothetical protein
MTSRLSIYNGALLECGERELASLSENREPRRLLDRVWDNGAVDFCLAAGQWKFAKRSLELVSTPSISPGFGYAFAFELPTDHLRTTALCSDPYMNVPLLQYSQERRYWFANIDPIYVSYISNDTSYGGDMSLWPMDFVRYVEAYFASMIVFKLTQDENSEKKLIALVDKRRNDVGSSDAMEGPTTFAPTGSWVAARYGGSGANRGSRNNLIG